MPYALAMMRDPALAEALVQQTLSRAGTSQNDPQDLTHCLSLMRGLFFNTSIRLPPVPVPPSGPIDISIACAPPDQVMRAVNRLPEHLREILILLALLDQRFDAAAQVCGCPEETLRRRVGRAREQLFASLAD